jgi:hypothetical protein
MSQFKQVLGVVLVSLALLAPVASAQSLVKAVVKFTPSVGQTQRVGTVRSAGGRAIRVRHGAVVARMSVQAASQLRTAMGVTSVSWR